MNCEGLMESACVTPPNRFGLEMLAAKIFSILVRQVIRFGPNSFESSARIPNHATSFISSVQLTTNLITAEIYIVTSFTNVPKIFLFQLNLGFFRRIFFNFTRKNVAEFA